MGKVDGGGGNMAADFVKGVVVGSNAPDASTAQVVGDVAGALVPGLGEVKAVQDIWEGTKSGNPALVVGGLVGLIPVVGAAGKAGGKVATKAGGKAAAKAGAKVATEVGAELATKAGGKAVQRAGVEVAERSFKVSAMQLGQVARKTVETSLKDPKTQEKLGQIAQQAGERGLQRLVQRLQDMQARGESPDVHTRRHTSFAEARDATFAGLGGKPGKDWHDLVLDSDDGRRDVVGRHEGGQRGFRILASPPEAEQDQGPLRLYWWKGGEDGKSLKFGIEECEASPAAVQRIQEAYLNRNLSFRRRMG